MQKGIESAGGAMAHLHPLTAGIYFAWMILLTVFITHPIFLGLSLLGALLFSASLFSRSVFLRKIYWGIPIALAIALTNPLFAHQGATPLFFLNDHPITLEALLYGVNLACMICAVLLWCGCLSVVITSDKLLYLFGKCTPRSAMVLTMALRFLPLFLRKWRAIRDAELSLRGRERKGGLRAVYSALHSFSALVGWAMENAIVTAASMQARGWGSTRHRTRFSLFRMTVRDCILLGAFCLLGIATLLGISLGYAHFSFYPLCAPLRTDPLSLFFYSAFALLSFLPFILELTEVIQWHSLRSSI